MLLEVTQSNECIDKILDEGTWGSDLEVVTFSELYNVTVNIYEIFTSQTPDNWYVARDNALDINLFYRNGVHFDSLLWAILIKIFISIKE